MAMTWKYFKEHNHSNFLLYDKNGKSLQTGWEYHPDFNPEIIYMVQDVEMNCQRVILDFIPPNSEEDFKEDMKKERFMRLSDFMLYYEFPDLKETKFIDNNNQELKEEEVYRIGFDPEVIRHYWYQETGKLFIVLNVTKNNIEDEKVKLYESYQKASKDLKTIMEILQEDGFSRKEAFELVKSGVIIGLVNFSNLSGGNCV